MGIGSVLHFLKNMSNDLSLSLSLALCHVIDDLEDILRVQMVPEPICSHDYELVLGWLKFNCVELRLRNHSDLVRN